MSLFSAWQCMTEVLISSLLIYYLSFDVGLLPSLKFNAFIYYYFHPSYIYIYIYIYIYTVYIYIYRHRAGEGYKKNYTALKVPNWWRRALSRLMTKNLMVTLVELHDHICRCEKPTEGQTSQQHSTNLGFMTVWPNSILSLMKTHENTLGICKTAPKGPSVSEKQDYLVWWTSILSIMFEGNKLCSSPAEYHPKSKVCW